MEGPDLSQRHRVELGGSLRGPKLPESERLILAHFDTEAPVGSSSRPALFETHPHDPAGFYAAFPVGSEQAGYRSSGYTGVESAPEKEIDCVLIWDAQSQSFRLERVDQVIQFTPDRANPPLLSIPNLNPPAVLAPSATAASHSTPQNAAESSDEEIRVASVPPKHLRKQARGRSSLIPADASSQATEDDDESMEMMEEVHVAKASAVAPPTRLPEREDFGDIVMQPAAALSSTTVNPRTISLKMAEGHSSPASSNGRLPTPMRIASPAFTLSVAPTPAPTPPPRAKAIPKGGPKPVIRPPIKPASKKAPAKPKATKAPSKTIAAASASASTSNGPPKKRVKRDSLPTAALPLPPPPVAQLVKPIPMGRGPVQSQYHSAHPPPSSGSDESSDDDESDDDDNTGLPEGYLPPTFPPASALGRRNTMDEDENSESEEEDMDLLERQINAGLSNRMGTGGKGKGRRRSSGSAAHKSNGGAAASKRPAPPPVKAPVPRNGNAMALSRMLDVPESSEED